MNNELLELTVTFKSDTMHIIGGGLEKKFTKQQSLELLRQDRMFLGNDCNVISVWGHNMEKLQKEIKTYYLCGGN